MNSLRMFRAFLGEFISRRHLILELTKRDFKTVYLGSYLGIIWAFFLPLSNIFIFWFVFQIGFSVAPVDGYPYVLWLLAGIVPWFFFNDCINNGTRSVLSNDFLVKKVSFSIGMLPIVKILSALIIHVFFILLIFVMFLINGFPITIYSVQVFYYLFASIVLVLGLVWLTSSVVIFLKDLRHLIQILLQIGFYLSAIFWNINILPGVFQKLIRFNPVYYIIKGYRDSFIHHAWFWEDMSYTFYFWAVALFFFVFGALVFRRLRPHFADVL